MNLSTDQISQIKSWISKRGFTHTDVQYEILDHVASAIEKKMEEDPKLTLEDAFSLVHKSFGIYGFAEFEESIAKRLKRELLSSYWTALLSILSTSKIIIPALIVMILWVISTNFSSYYDFAIECIFTIFILTYVTYMYWTYWSKKHLKNYLSFKSACGIVPLLAVNVFNLRFLYLEKSNQNWSLLLISIIILGVYAVHLGSMDMIHKTDKLHKQFTE